MTPRLFACAAIASALSLAACGGGGSPVTPTTPTPTATPTQQPITYTSRIVWSGQLAAAGVPTQSDLRHVESSQRGAQAIGTSTGNILIVSGNGNIDGDWAPSANVTAEVSPQPSSYPATTFSSTADVTISATPSPQPSTSPSPMPPTETVAAAAINIAQGGKTVTATVGAPVNQSPSQNIIIYPKLSVICQSGSGYGPFGPNTHLGATWSGTQWVTNTSTSADLYFTGFECKGGPFLDPSDSYFTVHFPYGGVVMGNTVSFDTISAATWANTQTSLPGAQLVSTVGNTSPYATILFKTASGDIVKVTTIASGLGGNAKLDWAYEVHGQGLDGF